MPSALNGPPLAIEEQAANHLAHELATNTSRYGVLSRDLPCCVLDLMFANVGDTRSLPLLERKRRLKAILPRHKLIAFSGHRRASGKKFFAEAEQTNRRDHGQRATSHGRQPDRRLAEGKD